MAFSESSQLTPDFTSILTGILLFGGYLHNVVDELVCSLIGVRCGSHPRLGHTPITVSLEY